MTNDTLSKFWSFNRLKINIEEFESWIYSNSELEAELGSEKYLELVSLNFKSKIDGEKIRTIVEEILNQIEYSCSCVKLYSIDIIGMGSDQQSFMDSFKQTKERGGKYWWLYMSQCNICKTNWLIALEERQNDVFLLLKLNQEQVTQIIDQNIWPTEFDEYENLLKLSKEAGHKVRFVDPLNSSMVDTIIDLVKNRPNINSKEIANLLSIKLDLANELTKIAMARENVKIKIIST